ncbi:uncharacterized protein A4U43_C06F13880 [Asparagus officinalis]|uniref:Uncharacterized protein n=1 Tax=Asparagus officinalis TaxID=4686 RepID=A0A5P1EQ73_ASPOF|nr:uncharacterized protein A4U43_C06F13880 [Asparagus officinalis]
MSTIVHTAVDVLAIEVDAADMSISNYVLSFLACTREGVTLREIQGLLPSVGVCTTNFTGVDAILKKICYTHNYIKRRMMEENASLREDMSTIVQTAVDVLDLDIDAAGCRYRMMSSRSWSPPVEGSLSGRSRVVSLWLQSAQSTPRVTSLIMRSSDYLWDSDLSDSI